MKSWVDQKKVWTATFTECFPRIIHLLSLYCHFILSVMVAQIFSYTRSPPQFCRISYRWYMLRCLELLCILLGWLWLFLDVFFFAIVVGLSSVLVWCLEEKLGATSDSIANMNEQNDGDDNEKKQPDSDAQPGHCYLFSSTLSNRTWER